MEKLSSIQVHFRTEKKIDLNRLSAFIERVQAELMSGATFTGSLQTQDYLYSNISDILDFEGLYSEHAVQNWHITFNKGSLRLSVQFQDYQNESGVGVATFNHDVERNHKFRNMVLEVLDSQLR